MSSRNAYLVRRAARASRPRCIGCSRIARERDRRKARCSPRVLDEGGAAIEGAGFTLDYLEARHAETLQPIHASDEGRHPAPGGGAHRQDPADRQYRGIEHEPRSAFRLIPATGVPGRLAGYKQAQLPQLAAERLRHVLGARRGAIEIARSVRSGAR